MFEAYAEASRDRINTGELEKTVPRLAIMCGSETVALRERQEEMMMLGIWLGSGMSSPPLLKMKPERSDWA